MDHCKPDVKNHARDNSSLPLYVPENILPDQVSLHVNEGLYKDLLNKARGDKELAQRLIEYERKYIPDASEDELVQNAIDRWERDNG